MATSTASPETLPAPFPATAHGRDQQPADVFVAFGITGDLAKVMTFRSLYRLEQRGLLKWPNVGVAGKDLNVAQLRSHARGCIEGTGQRGRDGGFARFASRPSYLSRDFSEADSYV